MIAIILLEGFSGFVNPEWDIVNILTLIIPFHFFQSAGIFPVKVDFDHLITFFKFSRINIPYPIKHAISITIGFYGNIYCKYIRIQWFFGIDDCHISFYSLNLINA
jgi:hypothetical protein